MLLIFFLFQLLHRMLDSRQLGLKLIANVTYGYTSANFSGRMPCIEVRPARYLIIVYHQLYFSPKIFWVVFIKIAVCGVYKSANLPLPNKSQPLKSKYPYGVDWSCLVLFFVRILLFYCLFVDDDEWKQVTFSARLEFCEICSVEYLRLFLILFYIPFIFCNLLATFEQVSSPLPQITLYL